VIIILKTKTVHAHEFTDLYSKQFGLVVHEMSA